MSGSTDNHHDRTMELARHIVYGLDMTADRTHVSLMSYGDSARLHFNLNEYSDKESVLNAMYFRPDEGHTNTAEALSKLADNVFRSSVGDRSGVQNIAILVTDGFSNINRQNTIPAAKYVKQRGIALYVVSVGDQIDMTEITGMAGETNQPSANYIYALRSSHDIESVADSITTKLCQW